MPAIFSKNCIVTGQLDSYCLACCVHLPSEEDALKHIQDSKHKETNSSIGYFAKYEEDYIRKVNGVYLCEVCNETFSTAAKVRMHVGQEAHAAGRRGRALAGAAASVGEAAWHALLEDTCLLCNVEGAPLSHRSDKAHVLNLIGAAVTLTPAHDLYRRVDDAYQCLNCNKLVSEHSLTEHFNSEEHKSFLTRNKNHNQGNNSNKEHNTLNKKEADPQENVKKDIQPQNVDINANKSGVIKKNVNEMPPEALSEVVMNFAKKYGLNINNSKVYCNLCCTDISGTIKNIEMHITSTCHIQRKLTSKKEQTPKAIQKTRFELFVNSLQLVATVMGEYCLINDSFCIETYHFMGLSGFNNKVICRFCDIDLIPENILTHLDTAQHSDLTVKCSVITSLENEFVRQIKSDMYDCAYCGIIESEFDDMLDHLATSEHRICRNKHQDKFKEFKIQIIQKRLHKVDVLDISDLVAMMLNMAVYSDMNAYLTNRM